MSNFRIIRKIFLIILGITVSTVVIILLIPYVLNLFAKDIAPIDDSDLRLQKLSINEKDNAYFDLTELENAKLETIIHEPKAGAEIVFDMLAGKTWDNQIAEEIISSNMQAFGYFSEAASKPKYQNPVLADPANINPNIVLAPMGSWREMSRLSAIKALYLSRQEKNKEALDEALNSIKIGRKIQESQTTFIEYLVAIAMKRVGLENIQKIIPSANLTSAEFKQYAQELNGFYQNENSFSIPIKVEYHFQTSAVDLIEKRDTEALKSVDGGGNPEIGPKISNNYYFKPNETKLLFADYARTVINNSAKPCGEIKATDVPQVAPASSLKLYFEENAVGKILHDALAAGYSGTILTKCNDNLLVAATQAMFALQAYKTDTNNYPATLDELVPKYLPAVPRDPFDGKPLRYSASKRIIYSVGDGMQDLGGSIGDDWRTMANPTFTF